MGLGSIRRLIDRLTDVVSPVRGASLRFRAHELGGSPSVPPRPMWRSLEAVAPETVRCRVAGVLVGETTQGAEIVLRHDGAEFRVSVARWRAIFASRLLGAEVDVRAVLTRRGPSGCILEGCGLTMIRPVALDAPVIPKVPAMPGAVGDAVEPVERAFERRGAGAPRKTPQGRRSGVPLSPVARQRRPRDPDRSGCTKARFSSMSKARKAMRRIKGGDRLRAYRCPDCTRFHLTSKTDGGRRKRRYKRADKRVTPEVGTE